MALSGPVAGIDFGTTRSGLTIRWHGSNVHVGTPEGLPMPSLVAINRLTGDVRVGEQAASDARQLADTHVVIRSVKLHLAEGGFLEAAGRSWTVQEIAGHVLSELRRRAARQVQDLPATIPAVLTTPVGFPASARRALRGAAAAAGFAVRAFVPESTAALLPLRERLRAHRFITVADWGGGTLDVSVLQQSGSSVVERATRPLASGGDALDAVLAGWIAERWDLALPDLPARDADTLLRSAERAKRELSTDPEASVSTTLRGAERHATVSRGQLARLVGPSVEEAVEVTKAAVRASAVSAEAIGRFLFIGGSARLYGFGQAIQADEAFAGRSEFPEQPEWLVADGAALLAERGGRHVAAEGAGLLLSDGSVHGLVRPGDPVDRLDRTIRLGLVEDARAAHIPLGTYPATCDARGVWSGQPERFRTMHCLSVPASGFSNEAIEVRLWMSEELTLHVRAASRNENQGSEWDWGPQQLSLAYEIPE